MQIEYAMSPNARGRVSMNNTPNKEFLTEQEKQAVEILEQVGDDRLLANIYLHDADNNHEEPWAEVAIKSYSTNGVQHTILHKKGLFKKMHNQSRSRKEWIRFLLQYKETLTGTMAQPDFIKFREGELSADMACFNCLTTEGQQNILTAIKEFVNRIDVARAKLQALISI